FLPGCGGNTAASPDVDHLQLAGGDELVGLGAPDAEGSGSVLYPEEEGPTAGHGVQSAGHRYRWAVPRRDSGPAGVVVGGTCRQPGGPGRRRPAAWAAFGHAGIIRRGPRGA